MKAALGPGLVACALLCASTPPHPVRFAGLLVVPGLMALYGLVTARRRQGLVVYAVVCLHALYFSWSLRHVVYAGWVVIGLMAGLYGLLLLVWARGLGRWVGGPLAFALALAGTQWLRAHMIQFPYPHGQPAHALYAWPGLLGAVRWGGEPLAHVLLGGLAGAAVDLWRSWRLADPPWGRARRRAALWVAAATLLTLVPPPAAAGPTGEAVRVVAVEPGLERETVFGQHPSTTALPRLQRATQAILAGSGPAPELVLWPESALPVTAVDGRIEPWFGRALRWPELPPGTRLLAGGAAQREGGRTTPAALLLGSRGRYLGHQEKLRLVPVGEVIPFTDWLPDSLRRELLAWLEGLSPVVPRELPGRRSPPLQTAGGLSFGALLCFDNAFDTVARGHVQDGARLLAVLSNEAWYLGGGELEQMVAMTVFRALEVGTPVVRDTMDGVTLAVDAAGRVVERLAPREPDAVPEARVLDVILEAGPGRLPPLVWLRDVVLGLVLGSGVLLVLHRALACARLKQDPSAATTAASDAVPGGPADGGS